MHAGALHLRGVRRIVGVLAFGAAFGSGAATFHPADTGQDNRIDQGELTRYAAAFASGETWPVSPSPIPAEYLNQASQIWRNGEVYLEIAGVAFPQAWVPAPTGGPVFLAASDLAPEALDRIEIFGIPQEITNVVAEVQVPGGIEIFYTVVTEDDTGKWEMIVPLHPDSSDGGGEVNVTLRTQTEFFPLGRLNISPLPAAPGTGAAIAADMVELQDLFGGLLGYGLSIFQNYPDEWVLSSVPNEARGLVMLDELVRQANNEDSLSRILEGTAPSLTGLGYNADLADRIWAKLGVRDYLNTIRLALSSAPPPPPFPGLQEFRFVISDSTLPIKDLEGLSYWMQQQCDAEVNSASGTARDDYIQRGGDVFAGLSVMGPTGRAMSLGGAPVLFALSTYNEALANLLPADATFELVVTKPFFLEDFCEVGQWDAFIHATSRGWSVDKSLLVGAFQAFSGARAAASVRASAASEGAFEAFSKEAGDYVEAIADRALGRFFPDDTGVLEIEPSYWENIPIGEADLDQVNVEYLGTAIKQAPLGKRFYEPAAVGSAGLKVELVPGLLGCEAQLGYTQVIEVKENKVALIPNGGNVRPGQTIRFTAIVSDAEHKELGFGASHGDVVSTTYNDETGVHQLEWQAPPANEFPSEPIEITARSLTQECLRNGVVRERIAYFTKPPQQLVIGPAVNCVQKGSEVIFRVEDRAAEPLPQIQWEWSGPGTLVASGSQATYFAPSESAPSVTVRATTVEAEPQVLELTFQVATCMDALTTFAINRQTGTQDIYNGSILMQDATGSGDWSAIDGYVLDGDLNIAQMANGTITGTATGIGLSEREVAGYYADPDNWDRGDYRLYETYNPNIGTYDYGVAAQLDLEGISPDGTAIQRLGPNQVRVFFDGSESRLDGIVDWELASWFWDFGDGYFEQGETVFHDYTLDPQFEFQVTLQVTDQKGNTASRTKVIRLIRFDLDFTGSFLEDGITQCLSNGNPADGCEGSLTIRGVRSGTVPQIWMNGAPSTTPGVHGIQFNHKDSQ